MITLKKNFSRFLKDEIYDRNFLSRLVSYLKCIKIYIDLYYLKKIRQFKRVKVYTFFYRLKETKFVWLLVDPLEAQQGEEERKKTRKRAGRDRRDTSRSHNNSAFILRSVPFFARTHEPRITRRQKFTQHTHISLCARKGYLRVYM